MLRHIALAVTVAMNGLWTPAMAQDALACVRASCEPVASACIEAASADFEDCKAAVNQKCRSVPMAEMATCLITNLRQCSDDSRPQEKACADTFRVCFAGCGPMPGPGPYFFCTGDIARGKSASFCEGDPANPRTIQPCLPAFFARGGGGGASCESL